MNDSLKQELQGLCGRVLFDESLAEYTTIRVGGPADAFVYPKTIEEVTALALFARKNKLPLFVFGAGSNLIVRDKGIRGIVIQLSEGFSELRVDREEEEAVVLYVETGVGLPRLVDFTAEEGLTGAEPVCGIPGNVGGALIMNAGTPEGSIGNLVEAVTFLDGGSSRGEVLSPHLKTWTREEIRFGYRESHFPKGAILLSARLKFRRMPSELVRGRIQGYRALRIETQPLTLPNLGSVFKNPRPQGRAQQAAPLHAGKLIEEAGLKDVRVGGARISPKHGNFIVNEGGAKAKDVISLIGLIRDKVKEKFGVLLEPEVRIVGEE